MADVTTFAPEAAQQNKPQLKKKGEIKVDPRIRLKKQEPVGLPKYKCSCCGREYPSQAGNFSVTFSPLFEKNNGYITICKPCLEAYYNQLIGFYMGDEEQALEHCCRLFDWYYDPGASALTKAAPRGRSRVTLYPAKMSAVRARGTTYLDTLRERYAQDFSIGAGLTKSNEQEEQSEPAPPEEIIPETTAPKELIMFFGAGYTDDEYDFLSGQYEDWSTRYECKTKAQEELFKNLCIAQLNIQRAQQDSNAKGVTDAMRTFQDLLGAANLKPSQNTGNVLDGQNTFGTLIKKVEDTRPVGEPAEEWKDVDGIKKYFDTWFLGHLCNLVHVKNDAEEEYLKEMGKYTVTPPEYDEDDYADSSLLDKYSDKGGDDSDNS